ncbi:MAG: hypothetical protein J5651_07430 [Salinivirgaceae bacterium]|nr:hypothetical protein [Salinivirgaceae bacterium]
MKKQFVKILSLCVLGATTVFVSCDKNNDDEKPEVKNEKRVYILNEGSWNGNNSTLDVYYPDGENDYQSKIFAAANGQGLGDTGQDLLAYGDRIYVSVWGSNYLAKLDPKGKIVEKHEFTPEEGQPRYLAAKDGFIYVSTYGDAVLKFDTTSIAVSLGKVAVGSNPEGIAVAGNNLIVCNSQKDGAVDNRISVIDLATFTLKKQIESAEFNNYQIACVVNDSVYVTYYTPMYAIEMLNIDVEAGTIKHSGAATKMVSYNEKLYCANSATVYDANWVPTTNTNFFVRDIKAGTDTEILDLTSTPEIKTASVYLFEIDPNNGDYYVGTTDSQTNGNIYRFDKDGNFIVKFETSGINPNHAAFLK